tara:strand:+ start:481 stop:813 length:333 start_codon:yes stop_codon:yes gene_type:complete
MENLSYKIIAYLGRTPNFDEEVILMSDVESGVSKSYIGQWNITEKTKPTDEELNALESEATKLENNAKADSNRKAEYLSWEEQLDYIYHNGITKWKTDHIKPIKDKYPKE